MRAACDEHDVVAMLRETAADHSPDRAGAKNDGATVFLVPAPNCEAALHAGVDGIQLVKISTLTDAISALKALSAGTGDVPACTR